MILLGCLGKSIDKPLRALAQSDPKGPVLAYDLAFAFGDNSASKADKRVAPLKRRITNVDQIATDLKRWLLPSWYRDRALESLYRVSKREEEYNALIDQGNREKYSLIYAGWVSVASMISTLYSSYFQTPI